ncbi:bifunctional methylenetetrahydrofolate dehydrogenase/methenyltetrahydrofolate cyclohydrolase FolD [Gordonia terrae]|uniref:bifunctional methylenetetrahydrofolate dehydrogenase/methenyltetrahydrofolate cyclohydrolase FolD n=1 Tax=Gordonia hongkongensis TaxID=1701090 RepID=UPI0022B5B34C|nr:bifunctional methylenetetrahydrofolate dehydrogenase/methenyltetrahydrofolate cyclohydrolase FolD [Gordonia terrae]
MTAEYIDGKAVAEAVRAEVAVGVDAHLSATGRRPGLATLLIGDDPASEVYVRNKRRLCRDVGMADRHQHLPGDVSQRAVEETIDALAADTSVSGILLQLPAPPHLDAEELVGRIPAGKDVDGLTIWNAGLLAQNREGLRPCTPSGVMRLLDHAAVQIAGAHAVVVGRSALVGRPMAQMLTNRDATVTVCHSRTVDLEAVCKTADILVVAAGRPRMLDADAVKPGAVVIDVGIHRTADGLCGDVDTDSASRVASMITPVPGGVGPMTIAMLLENTLIAEKATANALIANAAD